MKKKHSQNRPLPSSPKTFWDFQTLSGVANEQCRVSSSKFQSCAVKQLKVFITIDVVCKIVHLSFQVINYLPNLKGVVTRWQFKPCTPPVLCKLRQPKLFVREGTSDLRLFKVVVFTFIFQHLGFNSKKTQAVCCMRSRRHIIIPTEIKALKCWGKETQVLKSIKFLSL